MTDPGAMRHRVAIQQRQPVLDAAGQKTGLWNEIATRWAKLEATPGREVFASSERQGRLPVLWRLRRDSITKTITPDMRLVWDSKVYEIKSAFDPSGMNVEILLTTELLDGVTP